MRHLFRVAASLDSLIVGEGQIAGQVKQAYELALAHGSRRPLLHALFQHARRVAKRVRTETGIARGHVSVSSAAVDYVRQVFDHFGDKTILVIGAGKMGDLTLRHLAELRPKKIVVTNRSPEKARSRRRWLRRRGRRRGSVSTILLARADIVLSTTGAPEPVVTAERWADIAAPANGRASRDPRHRRAARLRPGHSRRRPDVPVQHRRPGPYPRDDAGRSPPPRRVRPKKS